MKYKVIAALLVSLNSCMSVAWAGHIDYYRDLLLSKKFFLSYEEITPQPRQTNKDRVRLTGSNSMPTRAADFLMNKKTDVIVVENTGDKYEEVCSEHGAMCRLKNGYRVYNFTKRTDKGKNIYYGKKKGEVEVLPFNQLAAAELGESYGTEDMSIVLKALLPTHLRSSRAMEFRQVGSGKNKDGLDYVDYRADIQSGMYVIRYYFEAGKMVKIASARYFIDKSGKFDGTRHIMKIKEFSSNVRPSYLRLPEGLKVVERREN